MVSIHIGSTRGAALDCVEAVEAVRGRGLAGDRYCDGTGTWSRHPDGSGKQVTLVETEVVSELLADGLISSAGGTRRNIITRSVDLDGLIGRRFRIGGTVLCGVRAADPCTYLESLACRGLREALAGRGGLRADVLVGGRIAIGDAIHVIRR